MKFREMMKTRVAVMCAVSLMAATLSPAVVMAEGEVFDDVVVEDVQEEDAMAVEAVGAEEDAAEVIEAVEAEVEAEAEIAAKKDAATGTETTTVSGPAVTVSVDIVNPVDRAKAGLNYEGDTLILKENKVKELKKHTYSVDGKSLSANAIYKVTLVKGAQLAVENLDKKALAKPASKEVGVNAKNVIKAKKAAKDVEVKLNSGATLKVTVIDPAESGRLAVKAAVSGNTASGNSASANAAAKDFDGADVKKTGVTFTKAGDADVVLDVPYGFVYVAAVKDKAGMIQSKDVAAGKQILPAEDGKIHVAVKVAGKGSAALSLLVNGKKVSYKIKSKVK